MPRLHTLLAASLLAGGAQAQNMIRGEYWVDLDPGFGLGLPFTLAPQGQVEEVQLPLSLGGHAPGVHTIGIRTLDADGHWGLTNFSAAVITAAPEQPLLARGECFLDQDPAFGQGTAAWIGSTNDLPGITFQAGVQALAPGTHTLFTRTIDAGGHWGLTNATPILIQAADEAAGIVRVEAFNLSTSIDPGFGNAASFPVSDPDADLFQAQLWSEDEFSIANGNTLAIRSMDEQGKWSLTNFIAADVIHTSVEELASTYGISVSPNPFTEGITVRTDDGQSLRVVVYGPQGRLVHDQALTGGAFIDLSRHASGAYTAFFWKGGERIQRVKLVKQ